MRAVHFGAGNIGRGFLGQLYYETGYQTTFIDVVPEVVTALQKQGGYPLRIVGENGHIIPILNVTAVSGLDISAAADVVAEADLASTAVGVKVLSRIAPTLAVGLTRRFERYGDRPLNIIVCENLIDAGSFLREEVRAHLDAIHHARLDTCVGFVEASIGRMVPTMTAEQKAEDPLLVCVEEYAELPVDAQGFKGHIPPLKNMKPRANFKAYVERKLFVHNAGHATSAYLGYLRGHEYIWQAIEDPCIREKADAAMTETCAGLSAKHGLSCQELDEHWNDLKHRFANRALGDQVVRVAADPLRKLGFNDRLIGAARMCLDNGIEPENIAFAAAAAIRYDQPGDSAAQRLQTILCEQGLEGVFTHICGITEDSHLADLIRRGAQRLQKEGWLSR